MLINTSRFVVISQKKDKRENKIIKNHVRFFFSQKRILFNNYLRPEMYLLFFLLLNSLSIACRSLLKISLYILCSKNLRLDIASKVFSQEGRNSDLSRASVRERSRDVMFCIKTRVTRITSINSRLSLRPYANLPVYRKSRRANR